MSSDFKNSKASARKMISNLLSIRYFVLTKQRHKKFRYNETLFWGKYCRRITAKVLQIGGGADFSTKV